MMTCHTHVAEGHPISESENVLRVNSSRLRKNAASRGSDTFGRRPGLAAKRGLSARKDSVA